jgi:hypothetical protein
LDHAVRIGQTAIADAGVLGIELHDVHACDEGVQDVRSLGDEGEGFLHASHIATVLGDVAVVRRDDDRLAAAPRRPDRRGLAERQPGRRRGQANRGTGA